MTSVCLSMDTPLRRPAGRSVSEPRRDGLWPIVKRLPAYMKLAWALLREPAIPGRHKLPLYSVAVYEVSPPHMVIAAIPVLGQVDSILLFLLGIRHALAHCPAKVARRHLSRLGLPPTQMRDDLTAIRSALGRVFGKTGGALGANVRFAGRVTRNFAYLRLYRMVNGWLAE